MGISRNGATVNISEPACDISPTTPSLCFRCDATATDRHATDRYCRSTSPLYIATSLVHCCRVCSVMHPSTLTMGLPMYLDDPHETVLMPWDRRCHNRDKGDITRPPVCLLKRSKKAFRAFTVLQTVSLLFTTVPLLFLPTALPTLPRMFQQLHHR